MPAGLMKLVNGLPTMIQPYDQQIFYSTGLAASTAITLPSSGTFHSSTASDLLVILNATVVEVTNDFTVVGSGPNYTQIQFNYALPNASTLIFKQVVG
jgi:hypothetical protein